MEDAAYTVTQHDCFVRLLKTIALLGFCGVSTLAFCYPDIYPDGACNINYAWENGKASTWYIELQREGGYAIEAGIPTETDADIQAGISALNWGFKKQAADGSFPGTGDAFHSTSLFVEEAAHALIALQNYHPVTYTANYTSTINAMIPKLDLACKWLTEPAIMAVGVANDAPYTHRRYVMASALAETAYLANDPSLLPTAEQFATNGMALQWSNGVNPELGGYDVEYQITGLNCAFHYLAVTTGGPLTTKMLNMVNLGLGWEETMINQQGVVNIAGSTRVGIEHNRDGSLKEPTISDILAAFQQGAKQFGTFMYTVTANRLMQPFYPAQSVAFSPDGAVGTNENYADGTSSTYSLANQRYEYDWIYAGLWLQNNSLYTNGNSILGWAVAQQAANGSFPNCPALPYNVDTFIECVARTAMAISNYQAASGDTSPKWAAQIQQCQNVVTLAANAMMTPQEQASITKEVAGSTSNEWLTAAAYKMAANIDGSSAQSAFADKFAATALSMETTSGIDPENGISDLNDQANSVLYAIDYYYLCSDPNVKAKVGMMIETAMQYEYSFVSAAGVMPSSNGKAPSYYHIADAFLEAYRITWSPHFLLAYNRIVAGQSTYMTYYP